jgi:hypothetical protein
MAAAWQPGIPLRFVERDGQRILQQVWLRIGPSYGPDGRTGWVNDGKHEWRDGPMQAPENEYPRFWSEEEI